MKFEVTVLGSSSATPMYNRNPSAQLLNCNDKFYLIDCGEGTQHQLIRYGIKASKIDYIFISHLHGDHYFGLIGLLSSLHLNGRVKPMHIYGPAPLKEILDIQFLHSDTLLKYPIYFTPLESEVSSVILENKDLIIETIPLNHRIPCTGFKFSQQRQSRKLLTAKLEAANVDVSYYGLLKRGIDVELLDGRKIDFNSYTAEPDPIKSYCYCSDTLLDTKYFPIIENCTLLYHETTFLHELLERAQLTHHTTALQAAEAAKVNKVGKLLIGHFSSRYKSLEPLLEEAISVFENTELAIEGKTFQA